MHKFDQFEELVIQTYAAARGISAGDVCNDFKWYLARGVPQEQQINALQSWLWKMKGIKLEREIPEFTTDDDGSLENVDV